MDANRLVSLEKLIDLLWPVSPTRTAAHAVQVCVSKLRSLLTGSGAELITEGSAYFLFGNRPVPRGLRLMAWSRCW